MFRKARFLTVVLGVVCFVLAQESGTVTVQTERHPELGQYLVDGEGMSLYMYSADPKGESACVDACAEAWPPLVAAGELAAGTGVAQNLLGTLTRPDGTIQATYFGIPLYYSTLDAAPGDTSGLGVDGAWFLVSPFGAAIQPKQAPQQEEEAAATDAEVEPMLLATMLNEGRIVFSDNCSACHGNRGQGISGPALAGARLGDDRRVIRQVLFGGSHMPAFGSVLDDEQVASVVTFIRKSWGNDFPAVLPEEVMSHR